MPDKTPKPTIPEGREAEFLDDAGLAAYYGAQLDAAKPDDDGYDALRTKAIRAKRAAAMTETAE